MITLDLTLEQASALHDLVADALEHGGEVKYPVPVPMLAGLDHVIVDKVLEAKWDAYFYPKGR